MIAIITGDIINSEKHATSKWMDVLKDYLLGLGKSPYDWEIYRGDEFQLRVPEELALETSIHIKALIKSIKSLDVRMGIGLGTETFASNRVSESNGPAYQRSGRTFESLKADKTNLTIATGHEFYDSTLNLMLKLALDFMDDWSTVSAEIVVLALRNPQTSQQEIAKRLNIQQSAVSQRQKRARLDLVYELLEYYSQTIKELRS
ncbi:SatD family protein [Ulvibacterium sp.]|uniref:SatD family protein n=1 Tax=Ulvibacterium sp. TaxID=2665914 RepID=UPI00260EA8A1|nr:SatD family protein [Ulvibacterium sp.]